MCEALVFWWLFACYHNYLSKIVLCDNDIPIKRKILMSIIASANTCPLYSIIKYQNFARNQYDTSDDFRKARLER
jgi:hypothetical protein